MPGGSGWDATDQTQTDVRHGRMLTDGGTTAESEQRQYANTLQKLLEIERESRDGSTTVAPERVNKIVSEFLRVPRSGGGYISGLYLIGRLIVRHDIRATDIQRVAVDREPEQELLTWILRRNTDEGSSELSEEAFAHCLKRSEWRRLLCRASADTSVQNGLSDDQLTTLAAEASTSDHLVPLLQRLRRRDLTDAARDMLVAYFEDKVDRRESTALLQEADEHNLLVQYPERLAASLNRWKPDDGLMELQRLAELGCDHGQYDEVLLAVNRWLRANDWNAVPEKHHSLLSRGIEALIQRDGSGAADAISLYRQHIYPADSLHGLGVELYQTAKAADAADIADDILRVYDRERNETGRETVRNARLDAEVAEENGRWDEAFRIWEEILNEEPTKDALSRAINTRLAVMALDEAEQLVKRLEAEGQHHAASAYELRIAAIRGNTRTVVDIAQRKDTVFEVDDPLRSEVTDAYVQALAEEGRWEPLKTFLDRADEIDADLRRFYLRLAKLMIFVSGSDGSLCGDEAVNLIEQLLTSPLDTRQLQLILNLDVVGQLNRKLRSSFPEAHDRMDIVLGLLEILVSLHAERLIDALREAGIDTDDFERRLAETAPGQGGRQLLSELDREVRRTGVTTTNGRN